MAKQYSNAGYHKCPSHPFKFIFNLSSFHSTLQNLNNENRLEMDKEPATE